MKDRIDPRVLAGIGDLELAGRLIAEGFLLGRHHGLRLGTGVEFAQYRPWQIGESSRRIDWRLFGRSEKLFLREAEQEADFRVWLVLDHTASMDFQSRHGALSKFQYARYLCSALSYLAQKQDDEFGLLLLGEEPRVALSPGSGRRHWYRLLACLDNLRCAGGLGNVDHLPTNLMEVTQGSLLIVLSDFYQQQRELTELLTRMAPGNRDILALCLETRDEQELSGDDALRLIDPESGREVLTSPADAAVEYRRRREDYLLELARMLRRLGADFHRCDVDGDMDQSLRRILQQGRRVA